MLVLDEDRSHLIAQAGGALGDYFVVISMKYWSRMGRMMLRRSLWFKALIRNGVFLAEKNQETIYCSRTHHRILEACSLGRLFAFVLLIAIITESSASTAYDRAISADEVTTKIKAGKPVNFDNCTITGNLNLNALRFSQPVHFNCTIFQSEVNFSDIIFNEDAYFRSAVFNGFADFGNSRFNGDAYFQDVGFNGTVDFGDTKFEDAYFKDANFNGDANFRNVGFDDASFRDANFCSDAYFEGTGFNSDAYFLNTNFNGLAYFGDAGFHGRSSFWDANFNGDAYFGDAGFNDIAYFLNTNFNGDAYFGDAGFYRRSYFSGAGFSSTADFKNARFNGATDFEDAGFNGTANFNAVSFNGTAAFLNATFNSTSFQSAQVANEADFQNVFFAGPANFEGIRFKGDALFENATFQQELSLTRARYEKLYLRWNSLNGGLAYDDAAYMSLMKNFKDLGYYEDYDYCYYDYRVAHRSVPWPLVPGWEVPIRKAIDYPLQYFYGYGTRPFNAFFISLFIVIAFAVFWRAVGLGGPKDRTIARLKEGEEWLDGDVTDILGYSATVFLSGTKFFIDPPALPRIEGRSKSLIKKAFILERLLGALFSVLFFIAISGTIVRAS